MLMVYAGICLISHLGMLFHSAICVREYRSMLPPAAPIYRWALFGAAGSPIRVAMTTVFLLPFAPLSFLFYVLTPYGESSTRATLFVASVKRGFMPRKAAYAAWRSFGDNPAMWDAVWSALHVSK